MFKDGDLIFTQIGSADNAISAVTEGYRGARVNHVGVVVNNGIGIFVLEAFPPEVRVTNIEVYLRRSEDMQKQRRYIHARLKSQETHLIPRAIDFGLAKRNIPYDIVYLTGEEALYCSELIVDMFKYSNGGLEYFKESPMSFRNLGTGEILPYWVEYYERFGMDVPQGEPGSNPGDLSRDPKIEVVEVYGPISGYVKS
jgi:uncharacterized protein YycO